MASAQSPTGVSGNKKITRGLSLQAREARLAYSLVLPGLLLVLLIILFPMIWNIVLSFQQIGLRDLPTLSLLDFSNLSLENYSDGISDRFWTGLRVTLIYTIASTVLAIIIGLWAALVAKEAFVGRNIFRAFLLFCDRRVSNETALQILIFRE